MNLETYWAVYQMAEEIRTRQGHRPTAVVEFGSRDINGTVRGIFWDAQQYWGIDRKAGGMVDCVGDLFTVAPPFVPDCVVCCEVLEHLTEADQARLFVRSAELLPEGGWLVLTCAGTGRKPHTCEGEDRMPEDEPYGGVTREQAAAWLQAAGFNKALVWCPVPRPPHMGIILTYPDGWLETIGTYVADQDTYVLAQR